jgi:hypothetical protein
MIPDTELLSEQGVEDLASGTLLGSRSPPQKASTRDVSLATPQFSTGRPRPARLRGFLAQVPLSEEGPNAYERGSGACKAGRVSHCCREETAVRQMAAAGLRMSVAGISCQTRTA